MYRTKNSFKKSCWTGYIEYEIDSFNNDLRSNRDMAYGSWVRVGQVMVWV